MSNYNLKAKNKKTGEIEVFTAIDNSSSYSYLSEDLYKHYSSKEFNELYEVIEDIYHSIGECKECNFVGNLNNKSICKECIDDMTTNWIEEFDTKWQDPMEKKMGKGFALYCSFCSGEWRDDIKDFITTLLEKQREEYVEMIDNYPTRIDGNKDEVLSAMYTAKKLKQDIINLIKSHDKTS